MLSQRRGKITLRTEPRGFHIIGFAQRHRHGVALVGTIFDGSDGLGGGLAQRA